jgi:hypothetical protein
MNADDTVRVLNLQLAAEANRLAAAEITRGEVGRGGDMSAPKPAASPMVSVYDGQQCLGNILSRGPKGYEAFDRDDKSVAIFKTQAEAARALPSGSEP